MTTTDQTPTAIPELREADLDVLLTTAFSLTHAVHDKPPNGYELFVQRAQIVDEIKRRVAEGPATPEPQQMIVMIQDGDAELEQPDGFVVVMQDGDLTLCCPTDGCPPQSADFYLVDEASRYNGLLDGGPWLQVIQGDGEYHTTGYRCDGCKAPLVLPDAVEVEPVW